MIILHGRFEDGEKALHGVNYETISELIGEVPLTTFLRISSLNNGKVSTGITRMEVMPNDLFLEEFGSWDNYVKSVEAGL